MSTTSIQVRAARFSRPTGPCRLIIAALLQITQGKIGAEWGPNGRNYTDFTQLSLPHCRAICPDLRRGRIYLAFDWPIDAVKFECAAAPPERRMNNTVRNSAMTNSLSPANLLARRRGVRPRPDRSSPPDFSRPQPRVPVPSARSSALGSVVPDAPGTRELKAGTQGWPHDRGDSLPPGDPGGGGDAGWWHCCCLRRSTLPPRLPTATGPVTPGAWMPRRGRIPSSRSERSPGRRPACRRPAGRSRCRGGTWA